MASDEHKSILLPYQQRWVNDRSPLKIWLAARQVGKSFALSLEAVVEAVESRCVNLLLSSSDRQSMEILQKVFMHLRALNALSGNAIEAERESRHELELKNGSRIISLPASPDTVRGFSGNIFLDEFAFHSDTSRIWAAMYPTVTRGYKIRICSTANGKQNMFYRIWSNKDNGFANHRTDIYTAVREGLDADIEGLRKGINDPDAWAQEFECEFVDEATAYLPYQLIQTCESDDATMELPADLYNAGGEFYLGMDVGRVKDLSVFWILEKVGDVLWTRAVRILRGVPFSSQREELYSLMDYLHIRRACLDSSGLGMQLAEEAMEKYGSRVEPVLFTMNTKADLAVTSRRSFEDRLVRVPADKDVREDLHSVQKVTTASGNIRFDAARTDALGHADRFWALALACHAASTVTQPIEYERMIGRRGNVGGSDPRDEAWDLAHGKKKDGKRDLAAQRGF